MRMALLQHVPFEGQAAIADWAAANGVSVAVIRLYRGDPLPALAGFDMLTVMGGPMSVNDEAKYAWLAPEIALVRDAIGADKIVFGICLGAQMIAKSLGAKVYAGKNKEIGWFPVNRTGMAHPLFDGLPATFPAYHWHGETFDLPEGAVRLAETVPTPNQAMAVGSRVLGLQFHIEATPESALELLQNAAGEIGTGPYEQTPDAIRAGIGNCSDLRPLLDRVLSNLTSDATGRK
jgi:GMP synthase-like glutamine amidotransferase